MLNSVEIQDSFSLYIYFHLLFYFVNSQNLTALRDYYWLCTKGLLLAGLWGSYAAPGIEPMCKANTLHLSSSSS